jgi:hypothetical protein
MSIVKSAQLPNVGRCGGGLPMATFERLEPYVGKPTSTVVCPVKAGVFSRRQSCHGKSQKPCSSDGRVKGN